MLFNLGELNKCLEITNAILQELTPEVCNKIKPETFSLVQFKDYIFSTLTLSALAKLMTCEKDLEQFLEKIKLSIGEDIPCKHCIITLDKLIRGEKVQFTPNNSEDVYTKILSTLICAFMTYNNDYEVLAKNIHRAKDIAYGANQLQFGLFCDLIIGYCYYKVGVSEKSDAIYADVLKKAKKSGLSTIVHLSNYFCALTDIELKDRDLAYGLVINSLLILERSNANNILITVMLQLLLLKILTTEEPEVINDEQNVEAEEISPEAGDKSPTKFKFDKNILDTPEGFKLNKMLTEYNLKSFVEGLI